MSQLAKTSSKNIVQCQQGNEYCLYDQHLINAFSSQFLSSDYWLEQNRVVGQAHGRGITYFVESEQQQPWVLRHYYRGGLIGKLINDSYFFTSLENTRAFAEFTLLNTMVKLGLPVPQPVACRVIKKGLFYRADLLSSRIENAQDLVGILSTQSIKADIWHNIGQVIANFHQQGIYHHDLNSHNILLDKDNKVWVIDFDRGEQRAVNAQWQQDNIARLHRSFIKEQGKLAEFHWQEENWQQLMLGYNEVNTSS